MSLIFATQLTAVATAVLAVFAIVTAIYAIRAFRKQSREVSDQAEMLRIQSKQLTEQRKINEKQTEVLALQAEELRESLEERKREAAGKLMAQASRVSLVIKTIQTVGQGGYEQGFRLEATIVNASEQQQQPIYDAKLWWYTDVVEPYGTDNPEDLGAILAWEKEIRFRDYLPGARPDRSGALLTFVDAANYAWLRTPDGTLIQCEGDPIGEVAILLNLP